MQFKSAAERPVQARRRPRSGHRIRACTGRWAAQLYYGFGVTAALLIGLAVSAPCRAEDGRDDHKIIWAVHDAPPYIIAEGPDADKGIYDEVRRFIMARLDGYTAATLTGTLPRILDMIKNGKPWCFLGATKTQEREAFAYFSLPVGFMSSLAIVIHRTQRGRFEALGPLSLENLLRDRTLRSSMLLGRAISPKIDALYRLYPTGWVHSEVAEAFKMLLADRLDYLVAYQPVAAYSARQFGQEGALLALPFAEAPVPFLDHIMCPKTEWGRQLIDRINVVLRAERPTPAYRQLLERWSTPEGVQNVRTYYDELLLKAE